MNNKSSVIVLIFILLLTSSSFANISSVNKDVEKYLNTYYPLAIREMDKHKIPASIKLAQSILESGWGKGELAVKSNNHFGIKCKNSWEGKSVSHDDDELGECFRKYDDVADSYVDHSLFLTSGERYRFLFKLDITDYKGWAYGLKKAGYATNPVYAIKLIELIEKYHLYRYDSPKLYGINTDGVKIGVSKKDVIVKPKTIVENDRLIGKIRDRDLHMVNGSKYIIVRTGDTWRDLSYSSRKSIKKLHKYNSITDPQGELKKGTRIFISKIKRRTSMNRQKYTISRDGESLIDISQKFGIRVDELSEVNNLTKHEKLNKGRIITLR